MTASSSKGRLVLASASPRRLDILSQIGFKPDLVCPAKIDEDPFPKELPRPYAIRMALEKAAVVRQQYPKDFVLAADTVVAVGRRILPKAETVQQALECLNLLSGRNHRVYGGICLMTPGRAPVMRLSLTKVKFQRLHSDFIQHYLDSNDWQGKAGGYAIQGLAARFIPSIQGSYTNVVGLDSHQIAKLLEGLVYKH